LCKIRWEKHPTAFVKVEEGSEIYNFPIHHFVHFYSKFLRKTRSNRSTPTRLSRTRRAARLPEAARAPSPGLPAPLDASEFPTPRCSGQDAHRAGPTSPSAVSTSVHAYQGRFRATAGFDGVFAPKHEAAPLFKTELPWSPIAPHCHAPRRSRAPGGRHPATPWNPNTGATPTPTKHPIRSLVSP
jgi:hypothetical protein